MHIIRVFSTGVKETVPHDQRRRIKKEKTGWVKEEWVTAAHV